MRLIFGLVIGFFFILGGLLLEGGHLSSLLQVTSGFIAIGGGLGALVIGYPSEIILRSFHLAITCHEAARSDCLNAAKVFQSFGDLCVLSGGVGTIFGLIHVFENLDRGFQYLGPGLAVASVSLLYGVMFKLFCGRPLSDSFLARANLEGAQNGDDVSHKANMGIAA